MEKQYAPTKTEKKMTKEKVAVSAEAPVKTEKKEDKKSETVKTEDKVVEKKEKKQPVKKIKKEFAVVNAVNVPVSTKYAVEICKFIKKKKIGDAIRDLEEVIAKKKHIPMIGEYGHKHGRGKIASGAGKYPVDASKHFIVLLKSLSGNANANDMNEPYVAEANANKAPRPMGRFGRWERKRSHVKLVARELKVREKVKENKK
jgi:large subunit ribosomal protein L22